MLGSTEHNSCLSRREDESLQRSGACLINAAARQVNATLVNINPQHGWAHMGQVDPARWMPKHKYDRTVGGVTRVFVKAVYVHIQLVYG
jgi:hypothetical protein